VGPTGYVKKIDADPVFWRMGYFNYSKINFNSMLQATKYDKWITVDFLLDWENQRVTVYIDNEG